MTNVSILGDGPLIMVDDSPADLFLSRICLERSRLTHTLIEIPSATGLLEHLDRVERNEAALPALILLDVNMPGVSGLEALAQIRARARFSREPPIVMFSNSDNPLHASQARELGANGFSTKPADLKSFVAFFDSLERAA